jgi:hypothetical protein
MSAFTRRFTPRRLLAVAGVVLVAALSLGANPLAPVVSDPGGRTLPRADADRIALQEFVSHSHPAFTGETSRGPIRWGPGHCMHCHF